jgi:hypothetical protein
MIICLIKNKATVETRIGELEVLIKISSIWLRTLDLFLLSSTHTFPGVLAKVLFVLYIRYGLLCIVHTFPSF